MSKNEVNNRSKFKQKKQKYQFKKKVPKSVKLEENILNLKAKYENIDTKCIKTFSDFPISSETLKALKEDNFVTPTEIQKESIGLALQGHDILGKLNEISLLAVICLLFQELLKRVRGKHWRFSFQSLRNCTA